MSLRFVAIFLATTPVFIVSGQSAVHPIDGGKLLQAENCPLLFLNNIYPTAYRNSTGKWSLFVGSRNLKFLGEPDTQSADFELGRLELPNPGRSLIVGEPHPVLPAGIEYQLPGG